MKNRIKALQTAFEKELDFYVVANEINLLYFSGFFGAAAMVVPREERSVLYVYSVNYERAKAEAKNCRIELVKNKENLPKKISEEIGGDKLKKVGFDTMAVQANQRLGAALGTTVNLEAKSEIVWSLRKKKDSEEIKKMRKAAELTIEGMQTASETIKPGLREIEVAAEIEYTMRQGGSYGSAFDTIVASGPNSAYPHGGCGERKLRSGEFVVVDFGATYKNYRADMTRTFAVGKPSAKQKKLYAVVRSAQEKAFQKIQDNIRAAVPDIAARKVIQKAGLDKYFVHGLGHGIGLEAHEQPYLTSTSKDVLEIDNVVTDEPGIYILGFGGFRFEDTVLVRKRDAERLTKGLDALKIQK